LRIIEEEEEYVIDQIRGIAIIMIDNMEYKHTMYIITTRKYKCTLSVAKCMI
jgi:hypothetical protein